MKTKIFDSKQIAEIFELEIVDKPLSNTLAGQLCKQSIIVTLREQGISYEQLSQTEFNEFILRSLNEHIKKSGVTEMSNLSNMTITYEKRIKNKSCNLKCKKCNFIEIILHI
jgi:hypothetical protein